MHWLNERRYFADGTLSIKMDWYHWPLSPQNNRFLVGPVEILAGLVTFWMLLNPGSWVEVVVTPVDVAM